MKPAALYFGLASPVLFGVIYTVFSFAAAVIFFSLVVLVYFWIQPDETTLLPLEPSDDEERTPGLVYRPRPDRRNLTTDRFTPASVPSNVDVIVIGSGLAGLSCAAMLSRMGSRVLVLEQHDVIGGGSHSFVLSSDGKDGKVKANYRFDSGLHYCIPECGQLLQFCTGAEKIPVVCELMGERITDGSSAQAIDAVKKSSNPDDIPITYDRVVFSDEEQNPFDFQLWSAHLPALRARFPSPVDQATIDTWLRDAERATNSIPKFVLTKLLNRTWQKRLAPYLLADFNKYAALTTEEYFKTLTDNRKLASLLGSLWIDTGSAPHKASFIMTSAVVFGFPQRGGAFPKGGSQAMSGSLVPTIESIGGRVLVRADVRAILVRQVKVNDPAADARYEAYGVEMSTGQVIESKQVVSACGYLNTVNRLLPRSVVDALCIPRSFNNLTQSLGFVMVNIGLQGSAQALDIHNYNIWYLPADNKGDMYASLHSFWASPLRDYKQLPIMVTFPSLKEHGGIPDASVTSHTCQILIVAEYAWFQKWSSETVKSGADRGEAYNALKEEWKQSALKKLYELFPKIASNNAVNFADVSTPLSIEYFLREPEGGACGLDLTPSRFTSTQVQDATDMETPIENLWMTGQDTLICGQPLVQLAGIITAFRMRGFLQSVRIILQSIFCTVPQ